MAGAPAWKAGKEGAAVDCMIVVVRELDRLGSARENDPRVSLFLKGDF